MFPVDGTPIPSAIPMFPVDENPNPLATPISPAYGIPPPKYITVLPGDGVTPSAGLDVYSDSDCTIHLNSITWGELFIGTNTNQTVYIKNISIFLSLSLSMTITGWSPESADGYITVAWDQEGTRLLPGQSTAATLTLGVSSSIPVDITSFIFQTTITGTN